MNIDGKVCVGTFTLVCFLVSVVVPNVKVSFPAVNMVGLRSVVPRTLEAPRAKKSYETSDIFSYGSSPYDAYSTDLTLSSFAPSLNLIGAGSPRADLEKPRVAMTEPNVPADRPPNAPPTKMLNGFIFLKSFESDS